MYITNDLLSFVSLGPPNRVLCCTPTLVITFVVGNNCTNSVHFIEKSISCMFQLNSITTIYEVQLNRAKTMLRGLGKRNRYVEASLWPESTVFDSGLTCCHSNGGKYI
jgi:hypothetical protein